MHGVGGHMHYTVGTNENCCYKIDLTLSQLISGGKDFKHFIIVPLAFPKASLSQHSLGFH